MEMAVDFPAPLGPRMAVIDPFSIVNDTWLTAFASEHFSYLPRSAIGSWIGFVMESLLRNRNDLNSSYESRGMPVSKGCHHFRVTIVMSDLP